MESDVPQQLETMDPEQALFEGRVQGLVALITPSERPLQGLAGRLDWRFQGAISRCLQAGFLTGKAGECAYLPLTRAGQTYHLLLVGAASRSDVSDETVKALKKNLASLKLPQIGFSRADWKDADEQVAKTFKGGATCILK